MLSALFFFDKWNPVGLETLESGSEDAELVIILFEVDLTLVQRHICLLLEEQRLVSEGIRVKGRGLQRLHVQSLVLKADRVKARVHVLQPYEV